MAVPMRAEQRPAASIPAYHQYPLDSIERGRKRLKVSQTPSSSAEQSPTGRLRAFAPNASVVLVGIRACGKRSLGFIAATALGRKLITEDHYFRTVTGLSRQEYLKTHGNQSFHQQDVLVAKQMLEDNKTGCVIECGLGSLTSSVQEYLKSYATTNPVVHVVRDLAKIKQLLQLDEKSARMLEVADATHRRCSNFEYYNLEDKSTEGHADEDHPDRKSPTYSFKLKDAKEDFSRFLRLITSPTGADPSHSQPFSLIDVPVCSRLYTHSFIVPFSAFEDGHLDFSHLESCGDVVEIRVGRWKATSKLVLSKMVAQLRRDIGVPIMVSVERANADLKDKDLVILRHALRIGVELMSVDLHLSDKDIIGLFNEKGNTCLVGHWIEHSSGSAGWQDSIWTARYERAEKLGCSVARLLRLEDSRDDNDALAGFVAKIRSRNVVGPRLIAYNIGALGRTSRVFNQVLTTVTHPYLRTVPDSGDILRPGPGLSAKEATQALFQSFALDPLKFHILGGTVSFSLSPAMHNAAYQSLGLSHNYTPKDITSFQDIEDLRQDTHFGGASIVQPYKVALLDRLTSMSDQAAAIGAMNTLLPLRKRGDGTVYSLPEQAAQRNRAGPIAGWYGDNTDWLGTMRCLDRNLSPRNVIKSTSTGLVIGAGGLARATVYAMLKLGSRHIFVYNRTVANAESLANHFNKWAHSQERQADAPAPVRVLRSLTEPWPQSLAAPTMIVSCVPHRNADGKLAASFEVPSQWLHSASGGVVMEMCYRPITTPLVKQIRQVRETTKVPWILLDALESLPEQAIAQFELMTGRKAPRRAMIEAIHTAFRQRGTDSAAPDNG